MPRQGVCARRLRARRTRLRAFWNRGRGNLKGLASIPTPGLDYDIYDFNLERTVALASDNSLVVGGGFRRNGFDSNLIPAFYLHGYPNLELTLLLPHRAAIDLLQF